MMVEPPQEHDGESVIARYKGNPIRAGFLIDMLEDTQDSIHALYRSGRYDLEVRVDFDIGRGQVKVTRAEGYDG